MSYYCKHLGDGRFDHRLYSSQGENLYPYLPSVPEHGEDQMVLVTGFKWLVEGQTATSIYKVVDIPPEPAEVTRYSVRSIIRELKKADKFAAVRQLLEGANYDWDFVGSNYLASDDPDFATMIGAVVQAGIMTQAELDAMLPKCLWEQTPMA